MHFYLRTCFFKINKWVLLLSVGTIYDKSASKPLLTCVYKATISLTEVKVSSSDGVIKKVEERLY